MADGYTPASRMRVSITGMLRNAAAELQTVFERSEETRKEHAEIEECSCDACYDMDFTGSYAHMLRETASNLDLLDKNPSVELFDFADLYALHGLAAHLHSLGLGPVKTKGSEE